MLNNFFFFFCLRKFILVWLSSARDEGIHDPTEEGDGIDAS